MTCGLDQMNPRDALYDRAREYPGGIEALAGRMRMSPSVLYKKLERNNATHHLRQDEFETAIALCASAGVADSYAPLRALNWRFDHVAVQIPLLTGAGDAELAQTMLRVFSEAGDVAKRINEAVANDGVIDPRELAAVEKELEEAFAALTVLRDRVRASAKTTVRVVR